MYRFASPGLTHLPCGAPLSSSLPPVTRLFPCSSRSSTGTFSHPWIRCSICRSTILRVTHCISAECGIVSKYFDKSASTISVYPSCRSGATLPMASGALLRPVAVSTRLQVRFPDRFQNQLRRGLRHPVPYRRNTQCALSAARLGNHLPLPRLWLVHFIVQVLPQAVQPLLQPCRLDVLEALQIG